MGRFGRPEEMADTIVWMVRTAYLTNKVRPYTRLITCSDVDTVKDYNSGWRLGPPMMIPFYLFSKLKRLDDLR